MFGTARDVDTAPYLRLICSDINEVSDRGAQLFILKSIRFPNLVLRHIPELKIVIKALCSAPQVRWGTISSLILAISNVLAVERSDCYFVVHDLLEICRVISTAFLNTPNGGQLHPHLLPLVQSIAKLVRSKTPDITILLELTDQCMIGFVPGASFIPFMSQMAKDIVAAIGRCDPVHYAKLTEPISSPRRAVVRFYTLIWGWAIGALLDRPPATLALAHHAQALLALAGRTEEPLAAAAKYLLDCVKVLPQTQASQLPGISGSLSKMIDEALKLRKSKAVAAQLRKTAEEQNPAVALPPVQESGPDLSVVKAAVDLVMGKGKKKSVRSDLRLLPDARMLVWGAGSDIAEGDAVDLSDLKVVCPVAPKQIRVDTAKVGQLFFTFADQAAADAWVQTFSNIIGGKR